MPPLDADPIAPKPAAIDKPHVDPVCGMRAATDPAKSFAYRDTTWYFCSQGCRTKFAGDPEHYLAHPPPSRAPKPTTAVPPPAAGEKVEYVCPMHPEVIRDRPGACPLCGMALEPRHPTAAPTRPTPSWPT